MNRIAIAAVALCGILLTGAISTVPQWRDRLACKRLPVNRSLSCRPSTTSGWRRGGVWIAPGVVWRW